MDPITAIAAASSITSLIQFSGAILSEGYSYLAKVARAPKELRLLLIETAALNSLLDQLQLLVEDDTGAGKTAVLNLEKVGAIAESKDILLTVDKSIAACRQVDGRSAKNLGKRLLWPFKERETKELLQRFYAIRDNFTSALSIDAVAALKRIERSSTRVKNDAIYLRNDFDRRRVEEEHAKLKAWMTYDTIYPEEDYEAALSRRQTGTSSWFLEEPSFLEWMSRENGFMWVYGIPGSGKTVLSSTIIEHLLARAGTDISLVYFYCNHQDPKKQSFRNFLGAGISQLLNQAPHCMEDVVELYTRKRGEAGGKPSTGECLQLLKAFTLRFTKTFIIVDALDESSEMEAFMAGLNELRSPTTTKTTGQVLITSRQEVQIERQIQSYLTHALCLTANIEQDIRIFIIDQVQVRVSAGKLKFRDPSLQSQIIAALCNGANGMFLWARIQLERICGLKTDRDMRKALKTLPSGLDETFIRILENIQSKNLEAVEDIKKVFQWVIGSFNPLPLVAVAEAVSIQPGDTAFDPDGIANDLEDIVAMCGSLVTVDRSNESSRIALAHFSIDEFLQSNRIRQSSVANFRMNPPEVHSELAKTCIQYLSFSDFEAPCFEDGKRARNSKYKLLGYASQNWIKHLNASDMDRKTFRTQICPRLQWFLDPPPRSLLFSSWTQFFECAMPSLSRGYGRKQLIPSQPAVFYALLYGIDLVLDIMFPQRAEIHQCFWDDMTPLHIAAYAGHSSSTERLLKAGANVDARTECKHLTPLHIAAEQGHAYIVKILLANKADPHARSQSGSTPFYRSPRGGSLEVLDMLRAHGSDVNVRTWDNFTTLHEAVEGGSLAFVERLVEWGADVEVRTVSGYTALSLAKALRRWDVVKVLSGWESVNVMT